MPEPSTPRRALQDLPVNTVGTPKALKLPSPAALYRKRSISEVDDPMLAPDSARVRGKDHEQIPVQEPLQKPLVLVSESALNQGVREEEDVDTREQSMQDTDNNVGSSVVDSDEEGDTLNTQQTAATELSQPARSSTRSPDPRPAATESFIVAAIEQPAKQSRWRSR
ncbi:MAG: hypothetical protein LQ352_006635 [Teloschistes flavicans]|nr:MAG: hypothetical protein LQ352_006635 [Teloschistes flavicans]